MQGFYPDTARNIARRRSSANSLPPDLLSESLSLARSPPAAATATATAALGNMGFNPHITSSPTSTLFPPSPMNFTSPPGGRSNSPHNYPSPPGRSPITPHHHRDYLAQVDEASSPEYDDQEREFPTVSQSIRAPLIIERDYVEEPAEITASDTTDHAGDQARDLEDDSDSDRDSVGREFIFVDPPEEPPPTISPLAPKPQSMDPLLHPRPGPQDAYLSRFLSPIVASPTGGLGTQPPSPEAERPPGPPRSSSAPGVPQLAKSVPLAPSPSAAPPQDDETIPLFKIFSAQLDLSGDQMIKRLKGHLEGVLKMQEEVGSMHLRLENLHSGGSSSADAGREFSDMADGDGIAGSKSGRKAGTDDRKKRAEVKVEQREKGVEEIMQRLQTLSEGLRAYHHLGTPRLSFPQGSQPTSAFPSRSATSALSGVQPHIDGTSHSSHQSHPSHPSHPHHSVSPLPSTRSSPRGPSRQPPQLQSPPAIRSSTHSGYVPSSLQAASDRQTPSPNSHYDLNRAMEKAQDQHVEHKPQAQGGGTPLIPASLSRGKGSLHYHSPRVHSGLAKVSTEAENEAARTYGLEGEER